MYRFVYASFASTYAMQQTCQTNSSAVMIIQLLLLFSTRETAMHALTYKDPPRLVHLQAVV